jgi:uncharacterized protein YjbJ (UPF0337 family)
MPSDAQRGALMDSIARRQGELCGRYTEQQTMKTEIAVEQRSRKEEWMSDWANEGRMQKLKGKLQSAWGNITDDDLQKARGDREQLIGTIKQKTGEAEEDIRRKLEEMDREDR